MTAQTYTFPSSEPDHAPPTAPDLTATVKSTAKITLNLSGATDTACVTGYRVFRDGYSSLRCPGPRTSTRRSLRPQITATRWWRSMLPGTSRHPSAARAGVNRRRSRQDRTLEAGEPNRGRSEQQPTTYFDQTASPGS